MHSKRLPDRELGGRPSNVRYGVLASLCAASALAYACRSSLSVPEDVIRAELDLSVEQMGAAMSAFFLSYALLQIPAGRLGQALGARRAVALYAIVWSVSTALLGLAHSLVALLVLRILMGAAQAGLFPSSVHSISVWLPMSRRAIGCGALAACMGLGGALGTAATGALLAGFVLLPSLALEPLGWRATFVVVAAPGLLFAVWFLFWFRDRPEDHGAVSDAELELIRGEAPAPVDGAGDSPDASREAVPWERLASSRAMWLIGGQQLFRAAGAVVFLTWFPTYLRETYGVSTKEAGLLGAAPLVAQILGSFAGGAVVDFVWSRTRSLRLSRQGVALLSMIANGACFVAVFLFATSATQAVAIITLGHVAGTLAGPCAYAITIDMGGRHVPTVFATMNMMGNLGAFACPAVVASFVERAGGWQDLPLFFAALYGAAAACWALIDPRGNVFERS